MREVYKKENRVILQVDKLGAGGVWSEYYIRNVNNDLENLATISFNGDSNNQLGIRGCYEEDLIEIVIDRLMRFQQGELVCVENEMALKKFKDGVEFLRNRTNERKARGIEGTSKP